MSERKQKKDQQQKKKDVENTNGKSFQSGIDQLFGLDESDGSRAASREEDEDE